jgi:calcium-dependent protein kinase
LDEKERIRIHTEIEMLRYLDHPNIIRSYEFYESSTYYFIVTEYIEGGELFDKLTECNNFTES